MIFRRAAKRELGSSQTTICTPDRRQLKTLILLTIVDQTLLEAEFSF